MTYNYFLIILLFFGSLSFFVVIRIVKLIRSRNITGEIGPFEVLEIQVPRFSDPDSPLETSALSAEGMFASLHGLLREDKSLQEHVSFEMVSGGGVGTKFYVTAPNSILKFVESQIYAQYPTALLKIVEDYSQAVPLAQFCEVATLTLNKEQYFPIKTFRDFEVDSLSSIAAALAAIIPGETLWFQIVAKPVSDSWQDEGYAYVEAVRAGESLKSANIFDEVIQIGGELLKEFGNILVSVFTDFLRPPEPGDYRTKTVKDLPPRLSPAQELEVTSIEEKLCKMGFSVQLRVAASAESPERVLANIRSFAAAFDQFTSSTNSLKYSLESNTEAALERFRQRFLDDNQAFVLNVDEMASICHLPTGETAAPNLSWLYSKRSEPPSTLPTRDCTYIGETLYRGQRVRFGLKDGDDRLRHLYLIGKSGTGKSTLLETMIGQDINKGFGVGVLDPHGETIEKVLERIPEERIDDVVVVDPSDAERPVGVNLLEMSDMSQKNLMASALVAAIKQHFDYSWGPRLEYLLNYCILTLLEVPGTTMLGITRLLEDSNYMKYILHFVKDPVVLKFWNTEYKNMKGNQRLVTEAIAPIQNKVNRFLASTTIRNILGQKKSTIDFWHIMNSGKILLMNLSKGKVGADNANLLGALLVSRLQFMALQRAKIPYEKRRPFYLYVDEFQNFATGSFEEILSESRKYKLGLYLTHQYTAQLPEEILEAVFGNVGTIASFSLGAPDAQVLSTEFAPYFDENDLISLERFHIYIKLMIDGMTSLPFSSRILLPWDPETSVVSRTNNKDKVLQLSRERYGTDRDYVESKVAKWIETRFDKGMAIAQENRQKSSNE